MLLAVQKCKSIIDWKVAVYCEVVIQLLYLYTQVFYHVEVLASRSSTETHIQ